MNRKDVINYLIYKNNYKSYLEIGLDNAINFEQIDCEHKESVDPFIVDQNHPNCLNCDEDQFILERLTYRMTSDELFEQMPEDKKYDIVFIDGLHTKEQVFRDIVNSFKHLNPGGTIVMHDCLPAVEKNQYVPRITGEWNGDVWKVLPVLLSHNIDFYIVDDDYGVGVIPYQEALKNVQELDGPILEYNQIFGNQQVRNRFLHVITPNEYVKRLLKQ